ncbi:MAG: aspartate kinase [Gammaproteobacteria bacterium]
MHAVVESGRQTPNPALSNRTLLFIAGHTGHVGSALVSRLDTQRRYLRSASSIELSLVGTVNRRELVLTDPDRHDDTHFASRKDHDWAQIIRHLQRIPARNRLFVDCTADASVAMSYGGFFEAGIGVITPNKLANSGSQQDWQALQNQARECEVAYRYETTVGAALPVLGPLHELVRRGERIQRIEAVLSGTLSFIFQRLNYGVPFSEAVREAHTRGYTEPHPASDLTGGDCGRKLLILMREAGFHWEPESIRVENLLPAQLDPTLDAGLFMSALAEQDFEWAQRVKAAHKRSLRLAYLACFDGRNATVGVTHVTTSDPFAQLEPGENLMRIWSEHYDPIPLSIAGPGAGPALTAAGVLGDILQAAN